MQQFDEKPKKESSLSKKENDMFSGASTAFGQVFIIAIYTISIGYGLLFLARIAHFILPSQWHWLEISQLQSINNFLFSGISGALIGNYIKSVINQGKQY